MSMKKKWIIGGAIILAFLLVVYFAGALYYGFHFLPGTQINGTDYGSCTLADVNETFKQKSTGYSMTITDFEKKTEMINAVDVDLKYDGKNKIDECFDHQSAFAWPAALIKNPVLNDVELYAIDEQKADEKITALNAFQTGNTVLTENARPVYENGQVVIKDAVQGNSIDETQFKEKLHHYLKCGKDKVDLVADQCYVTPRFTKDAPEVQQAKADFEKSLNTTVTYTFENGTETIDRERIGSWLKVDDNMQQTFDQEMISAYLSELSQKHQITDGNKIKIIDNKTETEALIPILKAGETVDREPVLMEVEQENKDNTKKGATYVDVNITSQTLVFYLNGQVEMTTPVVTGCVADGCDTPIGSFEIYGKTADTILRGPTWNDHVDYWMPYFESYGLHDADGWRTEYGGEIYKTNGSHGCVNMPSWAAGVIFNNADIGTPVYVHY